MLDGGFGCFLDTRLMLQELSVQEQKYQALLAVLSGGRSVSEVAGQWAVSRQSVHAWLRRYEDEGLAGLAPRSRRPASCPHQLVTRRRARPCPCTVLDLSARGSGSLSLGRQNRLDGPQRGRGRRHTCWVLRARRRES